MSNSPAKWSIFDGRYEAHSPESDLGVNSLHGCLGISVLGCKHRRLPLRAVLAPLLLHPPTANKRSPVTPSRIRRSAELEVVVQRRRSNAERAGRSGTFMSPARAWRACLRAFSGVSFGGRSPSRRDDELAGRDLIAQRLGDEVEWLRDCATWLAQLGARRAPAG
jgi:hypothetical protein